MLVSGVPNASAINLQTFFATALIFSQGYSQSITSSNPCSQLSCNHASSELTFACYKQNTQFIVENIQQGLDCLAWLQEEREEALAKREENVTEQQTILNQREINLTEWSVILNNQAANLTQWEGNLKKVPLQQASRSALTSQAPSKQSTKKNKKGKK